MRTWNAPAMLGNALAGLVRRLRRVRRRPQIEPPAEGPAAWSGPCQPVEVRRDGPETITSVYLTPPRGTRLVPGGPVQTVRYPKPEEKQG